MANMILILLCLVACAVSQKNEGDTCVDEYTNSVGRCTRAGACESARLDYQNNRILPTFCAYTFDGALVCCRDGSNILHTPAATPPPVDTRPVWGSGRPQAQTPVNTPQPVDSRPVWGSQNDNRQQNSGPVWGSDNNNQQKRVSERKCEEYSKGVVASVDFIVLTPNPPPMSIKSAKCIYTSVELIVGGELAKLGEFPHMAAIGWANSAGGYSFYCGGSLISPKFVLTAAHCIDKPDEENRTPVIVRLGDQNIDPSVQDGAKPIEVAIKNIHRHPDYKSPKRYNDIALFELRADVNPTANIRPACLWSKPTFEGYDKAVATGWGVTDPHTKVRSKELLKVSLSLLENNYCDPFLAEYKNRNWMGFTPSQMCAGELRGGKDTCQGDSGAPLQVSSAENQCIFYVMGVVSFGRRCGEARQPAVYTRVSYYLDWIEGIVWPGE